jgi:hypothetical protein
MNTTAYRVIPRCARRIAANWWTAQILDADGWRDLPGSHPTRGSAIRAIEEHRGRTNSEAAGLLDRERSDSGIAGAPPGDCAAPSGRAFGHATPAGGVEPSEVWW